MPAFTFDEARRCVLQTVRAARVAPPVQTVALEDAAGRVLAEPIAAELATTLALARSVRDGFAVRAADLPGELVIIGEVRAGESFAGDLGRGQAVEIMTGEGPCRAAPMRSL